MAKINLPDGRDIDEIKKWGGTNRHIVKRVADLVTRESLDSPDEEEILEQWIRRKKPEETTIKYASEGEYPSTSNLDKRVVVMKEVDLAGYRPDCVIRWPNGQPDGRWTIVEVKRESELRPDVVGHLLMKSAMFENFFTVRTEQVEEVLLADNIPRPYKDKIDNIVDRYGVTIRTEEANVE